jgi:preprotein translocase subunit SecG
MFVFLTILIVIAAVLLILLVLVQNSKGGGLAAGFSSGNQVMGAPKTADFLEKASWTLAIIIVVLSICAVGASKSKKVDNQVRTEIATKAREVNTANASAETVPTEFNENVSAPVESLPVQE